MIKIYVKVLIPGRLPGDKPTWVNPKQARRILIMRQKKCQKVIKAMENGLAFKEAKKMCNLGGSLTNNGGSNNYYAKARKKDEVR